MTALRESVAIVTHNTDDTTHKKGQHRTFLPSNSPSSAYSSREKRRHNSSCAECQQDEQQCQRGTLPGKCIRCAQYNYPCTDLLEDGIKHPKRRKVEKQACSYCRQDEHKCSPSDRIWPGTKCERCIEKSLPCSEPQPKVRKEDGIKSIPAGAGNHPDSEDSDSDDGGFTRPVQSRQRLPGRPGPLERSHSFPDATPRPILKATEKSRSSLMDESNDQEARVEHATASELVVREQRELGQPQQATTREASHAAMVSQSLRTSPTKSLAEIVSDLEVSQGWVQPLPRDSGRSGLICPVCQKSVKTQSELKKHDLRHRKPFFCQVSGCPRTEGFSTSNDLERHTMSKHPSNALATTPGVKKFRCLVPGCKSSEKAWPRLDNFRSHLKRVHGSSLRTDDDYDDLVRKGEFLDVGTAPHSTLQKERGQTQSPQTPPSENVRRESGPPSVPKMLEQVMMLPQTSKDGDSNQAHVPRRPRPTGVMPHKTSINLPQMVERWGSLISRSEYEYKALTTEETRILVLLPGKKDEIIQCRLLPLSIKAPKVSYEALSYCWGDVKASKEIRIQCMKRSDRPSLKNFIRAKRFIPKNLHSALVHLRDSSYPINLWVDNLCINMNDDQERSRQVSKMDQIYQQANNVCVWLGESDNSSKMALKFIPRILNLSFLDRELDDERNMDCWRALGVLISRPWFSRRWVLQEIAFAKSSTIHCGDDVVHWADFADAVGLFVSRINKVRYFKDLDHRKALSASNTWYRLAQAIVDSTQSLIQSSDSGGNCVRTFDLETLLWTFREFVCTDPRDAVYSLFSLVKEIPLDSYGNDSLPQLFVDYEADIRDVLERCVMHCVALSKSLDIICRPWAPSIPKPLPSWISTAADSAFGLASGGFYGRKNGDSFVGSPSRKTYNASAGRSLADCKFRHGILLVNGRKVDTIGACLPRGTGGIVWREALHMGGWNEQSNKFDSVPEKLWRTLVADRSPDGSPPKIWYRRACLYTLAQIPSTINLDTSALLSLGGPSIMIEFLERVHNVVLNRKFFTTANGRFFGLGPDGLQSGDVVAVLYGCSVPIVLRAMGQHYKLVGECYIHGLMDGQAVTDPNLRDEIFHLV
ncbi:HET-domain-containing protein [Stipitochalara longipes BDJ]|nr:HET-domain-containing protein [Stipitochalara longipes BDJ]